MNINLKQGLFYGTIGAIAYKIFKEEVHDIWCIKKKEGFIFKGDGCSKHYRYGQNDPTDNPETLLDKIEWLTHFNSRTVRWRRYILMSIIITVLLIFFIFKKYLNIHEFLITVFIIYLILYSFSNFYTYHYERYPEMHTRDNITEIRNKLNLKKRMKEYIKE